MFASVASHASTSANSITRSSCVPPRSAPASSPTSSMNHMKVPSIPRAPSLAPYMVRIRSWRWFSVIPSRLILQQFLQPRRLVVLFLRLQSFEQHVVDFLVLQIDFQRVAGHLFGLFRLAVVKQ